jgi:hypothetical protein
MDYKKSSNGLILKEFGRNVQKMVEYACSVEDRQQRNKVTHEVVRIMICLNPQLKEQADYEKKVWDSVYEMSGYSLDVDAPFPKPEIPAVDLRRPKKIAYYTHKSRFRQYGSNVELMIRKAAQMENEAEKEAYISNIASIMKSSLKQNEGDKDFVLEKTVVEHLIILSKGILNIDSEKLRFAKMSAKGQLPPPLPSKNKNNNRFQNKNNNNNNRFPKKTKRF